MIVEFLKASDAALGWFGLIRKEKLEKGERERRAIKALYVALNETCLYFRRLDRPSLARSKRKRRNSNGASKPKKPCRAFGWTQPLNLGISTRTWPRGALLRVTIGLIEMRGRMRKCGKRTSNSKLCGRTRGLFCVNSQSAYDFAR